MPDTAVEDEVPILTIDGTEIFYVVKGAAPHNVTSAVLLAATSKPIGGDDTGALGSTAVRWSDLFLAPGGVIDWGSGDVKITHAANQLIYSGASVGYLFDTGLYSSPAGGQLGNATFSWGSLFLGSGGVINFNNSDVIITHGANSLVFSGASSGYTFDTTLIPASNDGGGLGTGANAWSDLFLASGAVVNFNNGDVTITHSANGLAFGGAANGYTFDQNINVASGKGIDFNAGDVTVVHTANTLTFAGAATGYSFDGPILLSAAAVINYGSGDVTQTYSTNSLAWAGASNGYTFDANVKPASSDGAALGTTALMWSDVFLASGAVLNFNNGNTTITHSAGNLALVGSNATVNFGDHTFAGAGTFSFSVSGSTNVGGLKTSATSGSATMYNFYDGANTLQGQIVADTTANTTTFVTSSDKRGKKYRKKIGDGLKIINALEVWDHTDERNLISGYGVLAQDAYKVLPQMVIQGFDDEGNVDSGTKVIDDPDNTPSGVHLWGADYSKAVPHLIAAVQELTKQVADLKKQLAKK